MEIKRSGSQPSNKGPADWSTGAVRIDPLFQAKDPARSLGASVTSRKIDFTRSRDEREGTSGRAEAVKLRAIVAEESVLGGAPEKTRLVLDELEDIVVLQALLLFVVLEGKPLRDGTDCRSVDQRDEREQQYGKSQGRKLSGSVGPDQGSSLVAHPGLDAKV